MLEPQRLKSLIAMLLTNYFNGRNKKRSYLLNSMDTLGIFCSFNILKLKKKSTNLWWQMLSKEYLNILFCFVLDADANPSQCDTL